MSTVVAELPDLYEVVNGQVVEKHVSAKSTGLATKISRRLSNFTFPKGLGESYTEMLIAMPDTFEHNRRPDAIYVSANQYPIDRLPPDDNAWEIVPELCVEVVSPNDSARELKVKIKEYFDAGVAMVWVVHPAVEQVEVYTSPKLSTILDRDDTLRGDPVIPGFELPLSELFLPA
jgi:Uma2 family endonuclease